MTDSSNIVNRLREAAAALDFIADGLVTSETPDYMREASDEIERLRQELANHHNQLLCDMRRFIDEQAKKGPW